MFISAVVIPIFWTKRITRKLILIAITNWPMKWTNSTLIKSPLKMPCANNLKLLELFEKKTIIFGTIAIARSRLESVEEVRGRIKGALEHIDRDRLVIAPDCGLGFLSEELAAAKLDVMCQLLPSIDGISNFDDSSNEQFLHLLRRILLCTAKLLSRKY